MAPPPAAAAAPAAGANPADVAAAAPRLAPYASASDQAANDAAAKLEPAPVFSLFAELARIPRASGREQRAIEWIKAKADALGLQHQQDARGNLVVRRPAGPGCEGAPTVILQGHVDMVTENNADVSHDWQRDPVKLRVVAGAPGAGGGGEGGEGEGGEGGRGEGGKTAATTTTTTWLRAEGTTLGADNGVGLCAAMAVLALPKESPLPPIEVLVTVEEEVGLLGASALDASMLRGTVLLNLDSEEWPSVTIGCAGAGDTVVEVGGLQVEEEEDGVGRQGTPAPKMWLKLSVDGLSGGHSGLQIAEGRGNAVQMLATAARAVRRAVSASNVGTGKCRARLGWIDGGDKRNAIAREAWCELALEAEVPAGGGGVGDGALVAAREAAAAAVERLAACWREEYGSVEPGLRVALEETAAVEEEAAPLPALARLRSRRTLLREPDAESVLTLLSVLPHGPVRFSHAMPGLVETSNNTASVKIVADEDDEGGGGGAAPASANASAPPLTTKTVRAIVQVSTRSSYPHAIDEQRERVRLAALAAGATRVVPGEPYAGWAPDPKSRLATVVARCVAQAEGLEGPRDVPIVALHAGLECGVLREKLLSRGGAAAAVDIVSFGPTILGAHSPDERCNVETTVKFWKALLAVLEELSKARE
jgi:dipeptidase D